MNIFTNHNERRLRSGWRIILFMIIFWCLAAIALLIKPLFGDISKSEYISDYSLLIVSILAVAATISTFISRKYFDKKTFQSIGLKWNKQAARDMLFGFTLSGVMAALFLLLTVSFGLVQVNAVQLSANDLSSFTALMAQASVLSLFILLIEHLLVGYWEELVFRGYLFQNMSDGMGLKLSIVLSCIIYGLIHSTNPNASILSSTIIVAFGFLRLYGYLSSGMLWLSMGMHIGWNFFQGPVFGFAASGHNTATLLQLEMNGEEWLTGGKFGPEGSMLILPILIMALLAMKY